MTTVTWPTREMPVLIAAVELIDEMYPSGHYPEGDDIAARSGLDISTVGIALNALDGEYLDVQRTGHFGRWGIPAVTPAARRAVGQWPTAEGLIDRLIASLEHAADTETAPEQKSRLRTVAAELGGALKAIAISAAEEVLRPHLPH